MIKLIADQTMDAEVITVVYDGNVVTAADSNATPKIIQSEPMIIYMPIIIMTLPLTSIFAWCKCIFTPLSRLIYTADPGDIIKILKCTLIQKHWGRARRRTVWQCFNLHSAIMLRSRGFLRKGVLRTELFSAFSSRPRNEPALEYSYPVFGVTGAFESETLPAVLNLGTSSVKFLLYDQAAVLKHGRLCGEFIMSTIKNINIDLIKKYDRPGPRYTSYPPAPTFSSGFTPDDYFNSLKANNSSSANSEISLYYHIPFCDTLCYFCGCNMLITHSKERISEYLEYLKKEMLLSAPYFNKARKVGQLHWGGGTPSYLSPAEISMLAGYIREHFNFSDDIEAGVEIDPRGLTFEHMQAFRESGFNRVSMGVQDFEPQVQEAINRIQPEKITRDAVEWSRKLGFKSINLDMIYGLPYQTLESFEQSLRKIINISPERIAVFNFAHVPWLKSHQKLIDKSTLPLPAVKLDILKMTIELLTGAGYIYIGMDHFAKPDDELAVAQREKTLYRNFQGYSTHAGADLYAFGNSAISQFNNVYSQNYKSLQDYYRAINAGRFPIVLGYRMSRDDVVRQHVIMRLMCDFELDKRAVEKKFDLDFDEYFANALPKLDEFVQDDLLELTDSRIVVKGMGRMVIRNIAMAFDAYLEKMMKEKPIFSRTV